MKIYDLVIIGAGLSGLTIAAEAQRQGMQQVLLVEYRSEIGGMTRFYWNWDEYQQEKKFVQNIPPFSFPVMTNTTVTGLRSQSDLEHELYLQNKQGLQQIRAQRVVIATGSFEKPREHHEISGNRPAGIYTPSFAMQLLQRGYLPGRRVLVMENGRATRCVVQALQGRVDALFTLSEEEVDIINIEGMTRLEGVKVRHRLSQVVKYLECDALIFRKGRIPCTFFLKGSDYQRNEQGELVVDHEGRTSQEGIFAVGTCTNRGDNDHLQSISQSEAAIPAIFS